MRRREIGIIGGGASGLMAAISAAQADSSGSCKITVLEKKDRVGKKLLATGNGKCNLTNLSFSVENPQQYYRSQNPEALSGLFAQFEVQDTLKQFRRMGMLVMDRNGYVYPLSQQAATVLDTLRFTLEEQETEVGYGLCGGENNRFPKGAGYGIPGARRWGRLAVWEADSCLRKHSR
ncbi:NAD(P)/FAD-dependent oxidoreductase [Eisenbergiella massiliensis]|uniref:NAD(P)/FAD-dependent oxidoreductase n=1 Tax=Eisenbergiella massiliensis TaxID=1720294 RepID=UPI00399A74AB